MTHHNIWYTSPIPDDQLLKVSCLFDPAFLLAHTDVLCKPAHSGCVPQEIESHMHGRDFAYWVNPFPLASIPAVRTQTLSLLFRSGRFQCTLNALLISLQVWHAHVVSKEH